MNTAPPAPAPTPTSNLSAWLALQVAALLPYRAGVPWMLDAQPYTAWWSARRAARLVQGERALIVVAHPWRTDVAWELPGRVAYEPDLRSDRLASAPLAQEVLRLVLPVADDEAAARVRTGAPGAARRAALLSDVGAAVRREGLATHEESGLLVNSSTVAWGTSAGVRYAVTLHGTNPMCDVSISGPVRAVERAVTPFLPELHQAPYRRMRGVRGRLTRRLAAYLSQHTYVEQLDCGGVAFGAEAGPYGYAAPAADPAGRVYDTSPASIDLHGVGVDLLVSLVPQLCR
jgi:hypothetical protein